LCYPQGMLQVGCSGFPVARARYFRAFNAVELQSTFYEPPSLGSLRRLREEAPEDFVFTLKAWQLITHEPKSPTYRRLRHPIPQGKAHLYGAFRPTQEVLGAWQRTLEAAQTLRVAAVLFQSPRSFRPSEENLNNMERFFQGIDRPKGLLLAFEPRGWEEPVATDVCRRLGLIHCVDPLREGYLPRGRPLYLRLHGIGGYAYKYSPQELKRLAQMLKTEEGFVFFNNTHMFEDAKALKTLLEA